MQIRHNREAYNEFFLQELEKLNLVQQNAAGHFEGPMLVVAGPGTGKTQLLAARIGRILLETDTFPENILCLTFTDAGIVAIRERLQLFIGPAAHRVHIFTFHAFCNTIIRDHSEYFGSHQLEQLSDLERIDLIRKILDGLPPGHPLLRSSRERYFYETGMQRLFQRMNAEGWSPALIRHAATEWLQKLPEKPEYRYQKNSGPNKKGDLKSQKLEEAHIRMEQLCAAADLYPTYEQLKAALKRYDYEDMILWVLRAFERHPFLLRIYQERYLYILVDEYQDTNGAQNEILLQLLNYWENPNVFIVGDDDQSIFEFQGARLKNLLDFHQRYAENLEVLTLTENYRSSQIILDWSKALIQNNRIRLLHFLPGAEKNLTAANPKYRSSHQTPVIREYPNRLQENVAIIQEIERLLASGRPPSEIAVIYAQHKQAEQLSLLLAKKNIPFSAKRSIDLLREPLIGKILQILDYLRLESRFPHAGEDLLFKILHYRFWGNNSLDIAKIGFALSQSSENIPVPWRNILQNEAFLDNLSLSSPQSIRKTAKTLEILIEASTNIPLHTLTEQLINQTGILSMVIADQSNQKNQIEWLFNFLEFVREECQRHVGLSLEDFFDLIGRMKDNGIPLPHIQQSQVAQGIQLLTAHSAKGLEFSDVFLLDVVKEKWEPSGRNPAGSFRLPDTLAWLAEEDGMEARRRLFYVAMTRAKEGLYISYSRQNENGRNSSRAVFIDELLSQYPESLERTAVPAEQLKEAQLILLSNTTPAVLPYPEKSLIDAQLRNFRLSISALNSFLNCPLEFYFSYIVRAPQLQSDNATYGDAMHLAMKRLFLNMQKDKNKAFPPATELLQYFTEALYSKKGVFKPARFQSFLEQGKHALEYLYLKNAAQWHKEVSLEYTIRQIELDGVPLTGTIDKIEYHPNLSIGVVDYKTGRHTANKIDTPSAAQPHGGNYWRQLAFYKLLFESMDRSSRSVTFGEIVYLEPAPEAASQTQKIFFEPEDVQKIRILIQEVYSRILHHDFFTGCGKKECSWCALARHEILPVSFSDPEIEELDD